MNANARENLHLAENEVLFDVVSGLAVLEKNNLAGEFDNISDGRVVNDALVVRAEAAQLCRREAPAVVVAFAIVLRAARSSAAGSRAEHGGEGGGVDVAEKRLRQREGAKREVPKRRRRHSQRLELLHDHAIVRPGVLARRGPEVPHGEAGTAPEAL